MFTFVSRKSLSTSSRHLNLGLPSFLLRSGLRKKTFSVTLAEHWLLKCNCRFILQVASAMWISASVQVDSKGFCRWCTTLLIAAFLDFIHRPYFKKYKRARRFGNWISFSPQVRRWETPTLLRPLEKANLNYLKTETHSVSETLCSLKYRTMDKIQKPGYHQCQSKFITHPQVIFPCLFELSSSVCLQCVKRASHQSLVKG
jgi:hypothetical protein